MAEIQFDSARHHFRNLHNMPLRVVDLTLVLAYITAETKKMEMYVVLQVKLSKTFTTLKDWLKHLYVTCVIPQSASKRHRFYSLK